MAGSKEGKGVKAFYTVYTAHKRSSQKSRKSIKNNYLFSILLTFVSFKSLDYSHTRAHI